MKVRENTMVRRATQLTLVLATLGIASAASAGMIEQWSYSTNATFTSATFGSGGGGQVQNDSEVSWGRSDDFCSAGPSELGSILCGIFGGSIVSPDFQNPTNDAAYNRSALTIGTPGTRTGGGPATGFVTTVTDGDFTGPGDVGLGINITHWNNAISGSFATLTGGTIRDTLTLTPSIPAGGLSEEAPTLDFTYKFLETDNNASCLAGQANPCPDLFGLVVVPTLDLSFVYDDIEYFVSVLLTDAQGQASPIGFLDPSECGILGLEDSCQGFRTSEGAATTVQFAFTISADPLFNEIPVPAPLALLGLGLAGMGLSLRRRVAR